MLSRDLDRRHRSGLREDVGSFLVIVSYGFNIWQHFDQPFQTDRAQSALVGNIVTCCADVKSEVALDFFRPPYIT